MTCIPAPTCVAAGGIAETHIRTGSAEVVPGQFQRMLAARLLDRPISGSSDNSSLPATEAFPSLLGQSADTLRVAREWLLRQAMTALSALIGRHVVYARDGIETAGVVDQAVIVHGQVNLVVEGADMPLDTVGGVPL